MYFVVSVRLCTFILCTDKKNPAMGLGAKRTMIQGQYFSYRIERSNRMGFGSSSWPELRRGYSNTLHLNNWTGAL